MLLADDDDNVRFLLRDSCWRVPAPTTSPRPRATARRPWTPPARAPRGGRPRPGHASDERARGRIRAAPAPSGLPHRDPLQLLGRDDGPAGDRRRRRRVRGEAGQAGSPAGCPRRALPLRRGSPGGSAAARHAQPGAHRRSARARMLCSRRSTPTMSASSSPTLVVASLGRTPQRRIFSASPPSEIAGWALADHLSGTEPMADRGNPLVAALTTGTSRSHVQLDLDRPDGSRARLSVSVRPVLDPGDSRPSGAVVVLEEITGQ